MRRIILDRNYLIVFIVIIILGLYSCDKFEGEQTTPSFISVEGFRVVENPIIIGSSIDGFQSFEIKDALVYVDNKFIGAYPLPCKVPILKSGVHKIDIRPGVILNGMALSRTEYPFYTFYSQNHNLVIGNEIKIDTIDVKYDEKMLEFSLIELFENSYLSFKTDGISQDTNRIVKCNNPDTVRYGAYCGAMYLHSNETPYRIISDSLYCNNNGALILEVDYFCNIPFGIGICGKPTPSSQTQYINAMTIRANQDKGWQKIYVVLGSVWQQISYPNDFKIFFEPKKQNGVTNGWVYIDNIKVVHYPNK